MSRREVKMAAAQDILRLAVAAMTRFSWNVSLQLEGIYLLGMIVSQYGKQPMLISLFLSLTHKY